MLDNEPAAGVTSTAGHTSTHTTTEEPTRTRRRRAVSRPAGPPPEEVEAPRVHVREEPASAEDRTPAPEPAAPPSATAEEPSAEQAPAEETPKRTRKRAASATDPDAKPKRSRATKAKAVAETPQEPPAEEAEAPAPRTRSRAKAKAAEPEAVPAPSDAPAETAAEAPVKRRRTRKAAAPAAEPETPPVAEVAEPEAGAEPSEPGAPESAGGETTPGPGEAAASNGTAAEAGSRAKAPRKAAFAPFAPVSGEGAEEPVRPMFAAVPAVTFQAPAVVFQAPQPLAARPIQPVPPPVPEELGPEEDSAELDEELDGEPGDERGDGDGDEEPGSRRRRRRRGGRGRGRTKAEADEEQDEEAEAERLEPVAEADEEQEESDLVAGSRRRRRRRRRSAEDVAEPAADDPPNTVVRIRQPRVDKTTGFLDEVQGLRGSTRLEAKKQRRREGRELGRRRPPIITESEFLARRESVERVMVVRRSAGRTQIAVLEDGVLVEHYVDREAGQSYVGSVYLGKVQNVLPSMEAAFVDIGKGRNAVLYAGEVNFDTVGLEGQPKRIESALKSGQSVLVQVTKDPMGHKGARLTSQVSLPGRYLVYVPDGSMTGISRKLPDKERTRLKQILKKVMPENAGVIVRTAAEGASDEELASDVNRLAAQWENIQRRAKSASPPELLYSEPDLTIRVVRDIFNEDFSSLVVSGADAWATVEEYVRYVAPHLNDRLKRWEEDGEDAFAAYRIDEQIAKSLERKVWLPSGGSLVIDRTEAMTVIDVNTGKFTGQGGNLEETVTRNNLEAAEEIVRQLRLRDVGGIIVIDFIDMVLESNRDLVLRRMLECLARDRTKHQVAEVTSLGLVQMTRKRVGQGLLEAFSTPCECCNGRGLHIQQEPVAPAPEPRGTQGKMAVEKAVAEKSGGRRRKSADEETGAEPAPLSGAVAAVKPSSRATVTDVVAEAPSSGEQDAEAAPAGNARTRRRARRSKSAE
ncbi:Rne/Rng family ribonuclease [Rhizohabitans arisaemae]|uniref:Rne/Rng family ribonuclease n=1 Tax=Rhizohabitans arisaemae TaxID=2720610 RepID=UPI0024B152F6|nr:Rne/Rng family ribonuclease [Rhizohabitans arisaemae]